MIDQSKYSDFWRTYAEINGQIFFPIKVDSSKKWHSRLIGILIVKSEIIGIDRQETFLVLNSSNPLTDVHLNETVERAQQEFRSLENYIDPHNSEHITKLSGLILFDPETQKPDKTCHEIEADTPIEVKTVSRPYVEHAINKYSALYDRFATNTSTQVEQLIANTMQLERDRARLENNNRALVEEYKIFGSREVRQKLVRAWRDEYSMEAVHRVGTTLAHMRLNILNALSMSNSNSAIAAELKKIDAAQQDMDSRINNLLARSAGARFNILYCEPNHFYEKISIFCKENSIFAKFGINYKFDTHSIYIDLDSLLNVLQELNSNSTYWIKEDNKSPEISLTLSITTSILGNLELEFIWQDNGPGITSQLKETIFLPAITGRDQGTGTGLVFVRRFFEQHDGEISEVGRFGRGAKFVGRIPLRKISDV